MEYVVHIAIAICIYGILGLSLALTVGETGLLNVSHAAFYGFGAYATALLMLQGGLNFFLATLMSMLIAGVVALAIGLVFSRLRDVYYAFGTIGFAVIAYGIVLNWQSLTRGPLGINGIPRPSLFGFSFSENISFLMLAGTALLLTYATCVYIRRSSFGRVLHAIREDEEATMVFGYDTRFYKLIVFIIGAMFAALAGSLFASYITFISPASFVLFESIFILAIIILGGLGSFRGALLGAAVLVVLPEILRFVGFPPDSAAHMRQLFYGLILIALMLYRPQGILGTFKL